MVGQSMYVIRYPLVPEEPKQTRLDLLLQFCEQARIDEVMFFVLPEEYSRGQWDPAYYRPWLDFAVQAKGIVEARGLKTSLNPWHTLLHLDRGRRSEQLAYRRMVLDTGYKTLSVGCPICEAWRRIFLDAFRDFARAGFKRIWLEDDFRFHNHNSAFGWGGCFCEAHLKVLAERGAAARTREELLNHLNAPGIVHPDRRIWMDLNAQTYNDLARLVRATMDEVDPRIELGLMTSYIPTHAIEGRDWSGLIQALGGPDRVMVRPHGAPYVETCCGGAVGYFGNLSATLNVLPRGTRSFLEIENFYMSRFTKSQQSTRSQLALGIDAGCDGLTLDVLDFLGTGPDSEPQMAPTLAGMKDTLLALREQVAGTEPVGIEAVLPLQTTRLAPGKGGSSVADLPTINFGWYTHLQGFGYPCVNRVGLDHAAAGAICALSGDAAWGLPDEVLRPRLETGRVLLDAEAARIIMDRGLGTLIGLRGINRLDRQASTYSFEEHVDPAPDKVPERASVNWPDRGYVHVYDLDPAAGARTLIKDCFNNVLGPGSVIYANASGGRGLILPYPLPESYSLHTWARKHWMDRWLAEVSGGVAVPHLVNGCWVYISARSGPRGKTIFLANQMFETYDRLELRLPPDFAAARWTMAFHGRDRQGEVRAQGDRLTVATEFIGNDWLMLMGK